MTLPALSSSLDRWRGRLTNTSANLLVGSRVAYSLAMTESDVVGPATTVDRLKPFAVNIFATMSALAARVGAVNLGQGFPDEDGPAGTG